MNVPLAADLNDQTCVLTAQFFAANNKNKIGLSTSKRVFLFYQFLIKEISSITPLIRPDNELKGVILSHPPLS